MTLTDYQYTRASSLGGGFSRRSTKDSSTPWPLLHAAVSMCLIDDLTLDGLVDQQRWNNALQGLDVCWVGVRCAPEIAAERESRRGTRLPGIARHQAESVHVGVHYDIEVDTGVLPPPRRIPRDCRRAWATVVIEHYDRIQPETNTPSHVSLDARGNNPSGSMGVLTKGVGSDTDDRVFQRFDPGHC